jgi:hypothetical protein
VSVHCLYENDSIVMPFLTYAAVAVAAAVYYSPRTNDSVPVDVDSVDSSYDVRIRSYSLDGHFATDASIDCFEIAVAILLALVEYVSCRVDACGVVDAFGVAFSLVDLAF